VARYVVATHKAIVPRDWVCKACEAYGRVAVSAVGKGRKRVWLWFRDSAAEGAHDVAAADLQDDADRICELVKCPKCGKRAPNALIATLFHGFRDVAVALLVGVVVLVLAWDKVGSSIALPLFAAVAVGMVFVGDERRRYQAAAVAVFDLGARARPATKPPGSSAPKPSPTPVVTGDPFRELPVPPPIAVVRPDVQTTAPVVASGAADDKPKFLS